MIDLPANCLPLLSLGIRGVVGGWRDGGIRVTCIERFGGNWVMSAIHPTYQNCDDRKYA
jgi:hypothetical protein